MTRKIACIMAALALLVMGMAAVANADTTIVTTIDDFALENLVFNGTTPIIENFENDQINTPGLTITPFGTNYTPNFTLGYYQNRVNATDNSYQVISYTTPLHGFGGWFDELNPGGAGTSINVYIGTDPTTGTLVGNIPNTYSGQFWGFYSDTPFTSVTLGDGGGAGNFETYQIVDMALCSTVPIPPSAILLGTGLLGLVGFRFRRKLS
jgi:hypothetical protein